MDVWFAGARTFNAVLDFGGRAITRASLRQLFEDAGADASEVDVAKEAYCDDGLANNARDDVRLRQHQEVRRAFDLGDRGAGAGRRLMPDAEGADVIVLLDRDGGRVAARRPVRSE